MDDYELLYREASIYYPMTEDSRTAKLEIEKNLEAVTYELTAEEMKRGDGVDFHVASAEFTDQEVDPEAIDHITIAGVRYEVTKIK